MLNSLLCIHLCQYNYMNQKMFPTVPHVKLQALDDQFKASKPNGPFMISNSNPQINSLKKSGEWNVVENSRYAAFIEHEQKQMQGKPHGRLWGKYQEMAKFVGSRNFRQCKSHHQKLCLEFESISGIIHNLTTQNPNFQELLLKEKQNYLNLKYEQNSVKQNDTKNRLKEDKEENVPTTASYRDEDKEQQKPNQQKNASFPSSFNSPYNHLNPFPQANIFQPFSGLNHQYDKFNKYCQYPTCNQLPSEFGLRSAGMQMMPKSRQQKWKQCHMLFIEWVSRLNELQIMMNPDF